jgi:putative ABC transport system ATP-binding protein
VIELSKVSRCYRPADGEVVRALDEVTLSLAAQSFTAVTGPSGCGKSTLLHLLGALDSPDAGEIRVGGAALHGLSEAERTRYRRESVGIVFQFFHLLPSMTLWENVALPLILAGVAEGKAKARALATLDLAGMSAKSARFPHQISGGEMQRTAVARALVHEPPLFLADEPTGNLDSANADLVMEMFRAIHARGQTTIVMVTHSPELAASLPACLRMRDGRVVS